MPKTKDKTRITIIDNFFGGIADDIREQSRHKFSITKHFDIFTNPKRLTPHRATEAIENKSFDVRQMIYANNTLFGYGYISSGDVSPKIYQVASPTDASPSWAASTNGAATSATRILGCFAAYKNYIYGFAQTNKIWRWGDFTSSPSFTTTWQTVSATVTSVAQGIIHPADDILYFAYNNIIAKNNNGSFTDQALILPDKYIITSLAAYGNYLAIACKPKTASSDNSVVFLWDRDSSLVTISDKIDWGAGDLQILEDLQGELVGVTEEDLSGGNDIGNIAIKVYSGGAVRTIKEIKEKAVAGFTGGDVLPDKVIVNNKLYFYATIATEIGGLSGIWVIGRKNRDYPLAITLDFIEEEVSATVPSVQGIARTKNMWWIAHSDDGSINRMTDTDTYTQTSIYESQKFNQGDISMNKKLIGVTVMTVPLPTAGQIVLKYKKDEETSYTTIFTNTTDNSIRKSALNISGVTLPEFKEIQFKIESTGGAEVTGLKFKYEDKPDDIY